MDASSKHPHIYLVDDDQDDREMFAAALSLVRNEVSLIELADGQELMEVLAGNSSHLPDYIFLDLNMPKCGGMECLERMIQLGALSKVTVAVLSTSSNPESIERAYTLGANYYIVKPTNFSNLKAFINKVLHEGSADRKPKSKAEFLLAM